MSSPWTVQTVNYRKIPTGVGNALANAKFWRSQRLDKDNEMLSEWISGNLSYKELDAYYDFRLKNRSGTEAQNIEKVKTLAQEKKQNVDDEFNWNQYLSGHKSYSSYQSYLNERLREEEPETPGFTSVQTYQTGLIEKQRTNQQAAMANRYEAGEISYDQYRNFIVTEMEDYPEDSSQQVKLKGILQQIDPLNKINELNKLFAQGYWGNPESDGKYDMLLNAIGYQKSINKLLGDYAEGSPEYTSVFNLLTQADSFVRKYRLSQETSQAAVNRNKLFTAQVNAESTYNKKLTDYQNGLIDYDELQTAYDEVIAIQEQFNEAEQHLQQLQSSPDAITQYPSMALPEINIPEQIQPKVSPPETTQPEPVNPPPTIEPEDKTESPSAIPTPTGVQEGGIYKSGSGSEIFVVKNGKLSWIQSEEVWKKLYGDKPIQGSYQTLPKKVKDFEFGPTITMQNYQQYA